MAAWAVHFYTASGAALALVALVATVRGEIAGAFACLFVAVVVDATDGTLARLARVKEVLPGFDGAKLDDIVDFLTFVVVPLFMLVETGILAGPAGEAVAACAVVASAYRFCRDDAKTEDHFFTGFPSYWNIVALYLFVFDADPVVATVIVGTLALLVFAPLRFIYPSRTRWLRGWSIGLGVIWALLVAAVLWRLPERATAIATISLIYPAWYTGASFYLDWRTRRRGVSASGRTARPSDSGE